MIRSQPSLYGLYIEAVCKQREAYILIKSQPPLYELYIAAVCKPDTSCFVCGLGCELVGMPLLFYVFN